jgi:hypothetical protein
VSLYPHCSHIDNAFRFLLMLTSLSNGYIKQQYNIRIIFAKDATSRS